MLNENRRPVTATTGVSPTGAQIAVTCKGGVLRLIDLPQGTELRSIPAEPKANALAYSPDGRWLALGFNDGTVDVISSRDKAAAKHWKADSHRIDGLYFFPDSKHLFGAWLDGGCEPEGCHPWVSHAMILDVNERKYAEFDNTNFPLGSPHIVKQAEWSPDGTKLLVISAQGDEPWSNTKSALYLLSVEESSKIK